jgi:hypothetical protein
MVLGLGKAQKEEEREVRDVFQVATSCSSGEGNQITLEKGLCREAIFGRGRVGWEFF